MRRGFTANKGVFFFILLAPDNSFRCEKGVFEWYPCTLNRGSDHMRMIHELINHIDTKAKYCHLKNILIKDLCGRYLIEFID